MININFDIKEINKPFRKLLNVDTWENLIFGGSSSGKSYFVFSQMLLLELLEGGRNFLVVRKVQRTNKDTTFNQVYEGLQMLPDELRGMFTINKSEMSIKAPNGYIIYFRGLDDIEKLKGINPPKGVITDVIVEEASETSRDDIKKLKKRIRGFTQKKKRFWYLSNPVYSKHWLNTDVCRRVVFNIEDKFYQDKNLTILHTTYKDNIRHLSQEEVDELENEENPYYYDVYTLGKWGVLGDVIFTNWQVADLSGYNFSSCFYGLDFGWSAPSALVKVAVKGDNVYILDCFYKKHAKFEEIASKIKKIAGNSLVICDSAEPRSQRTLHELGAKVKGAKKPKDHMIHAIRWLQGKNIYIDRSLIEVQNEFELYQWQKDKGGESLDEPVKKNDHAIQAIVYSLEDYLYDNRISAKSFNH